MSLDRQLRRLLERHVNFHIPLGFGDPNPKGFVGSVIDLKDADRDRPVVGHLEQLGIPLPMPERTGAVDIGLSLSRSLDFKTVVGGKARVAPALSGTVEAAAKIRSSRDVVVLVEPTAGYTIESHLLTLAPQVAKLAEWDFDRHAFVCRTFAVAKGSVKIAREGGGTITLRGETKAVAKAANGELSAAVSWTEENLFTKEFDGVGVFGVYLVTVTKSGLPRVL